MDMKKILFISIISILLNSCVAAYTIPKERIFKELPEYSEATLVIEPNSCSVVKPKQTYLKPCAFTKQKDLKKLAASIDESVKAAGGNAYEIKSYRWLKLDQHGIRHFEVIYDVLKCE